MTERNTKATRKVVGPFNRVEGDLEVQLEIEHGTVTKAWVVSPLYRGFEQMLQGKHPLDALVYVPRICGICSVAQSVAAARALAALSGQPMPSNGRIASNLILACENLADHLTHFYLFFMPDFAREAYNKQGFFEKAATRFRAVSGSATQDILPARAEFLHITGILAGKWPHSLALQPGGTTRAIDLSEKNRLQTTLYNFRRFLEKKLFGTTLETIANFSSLSELQIWRSQYPTEHSDLTHFLEISDSLSLHEYGKAYDRFMSYGVYDLENDQLLQAGCYDRELGATALQLQNITEDLSYSWMEYSHTVASHPFHGETRPSQNNKNAYTWCKSPRNDGKPMEVGAIARQLVHGNPLIRDLVKQNGASVRNRVIARLQELAIITIAMENWARQLRTGMPFCETWNMPNEAQGYGITEAARGSLGHWVNIRRGKILNYQIIAPTTWNFSPRDSRGLPGPLELALQGTPLESNDSNSLIVQHIVRSFDPCMVCTVH